MTMTEYRITIGTATLDDFLVISNKILNRQRIVIDRTEDRGMSAVIECKYEYPELSNEEALQDIKEIKYQLILEARAKRRHRRQNVFRSGNCALLRPFRR